MVQAAQEMRPTKREHFQAHLAKVRTALGPFFGIYFAIVAPLFALFSIGFLTFSVAIFVFGIQALVVGDATLHGTECERSMAIWMIVFGSLVVAKQALACCCDGSRRGRNDDEECTTQTNKCKHRSTREKRRNNLVGALFGSAIVAWLCNGMVKLYADDTINAECNPSQYDVFRLIVLFNFFFIVALLGTGLLLCCFVLPLKTATGIELDKFESDCECGSSNPECSDDIGKVDPETLHIPQASLASLDQEKM